jgi:2-polyprenyl-3-methyl-5-hydroxy-6-metoxy-1,4-benzoquinol methylase
LIRGLAFVGLTRPTDYGSRLSHLRWRQAAHADVVSEPRAEDPAEPILRSAGSWILVREPAALPRPGARVPEPPYKRVLLAEAGVPEPPSFVHTLRELEATRLHAAPDLPDRWTAALAFWTADYPPRAEESIQAFWERLRGLDGLSHATDASFRVIRFEEPSRLERPELTRRLPDGPLRVLDVGCGAGGGIASGRSRRGAWAVTGIERDPRLAAQARERCDRVVEGDLREVLPRLARDGERFDVLVFADVLEHLDDPVAPLHAARALAAPRARLLVSVPNVGHLSVVRDLLLGRFDPAPAGLLDSGHLRWFTRSFLAQVLEETGWRIDSIESERGAPSPDPEPLRRLAELWPDLDSESLATYQWIAQAHPE